MKTKFNTYLLFSMIFLILISGCNNKSEYTIYNKFGDKLSIINVPKAGQSFSTSNIVEEIQYIPLEFNLGKPDKIYIQDELIYILDIEISKSLNVFKKNGELLYSISNVGNGPGEYVKPYDFTVSQIDKSTYITDLKQGKIIQFDSMGVFKNERKLKNPGDSYIADENNTLYYFGNIAEYENLKYNLAVFEQFTPISVAIPFDENIDFRRFNFFQNGDSFNFIHGFNDTIYQIHKNLITTKYYIDFGAQKLLTSVDTPEKFNELSRTGFAFLPKDITESENYLFFKYLVGSTVEVALYSKKTGGTLFGGVKDDINIGWRSFKIALHDDYLYSLSHVSWVKEALNKKTQDELIAFQNENISVKNILNSNLDDEQLVLLKIKIKDF